jgi:hypothetical protein
MTLRFTMPAPRAARGTARPPLALTAAA